MDILKTGVEISAYRVFSQRSAFIYNSMQRYFLLFLIAISITANAGNGGYIVEPHNPETDELVDTSGADATISILELPLWIQIAYVSGIILASLGLFKIIPAVLANIRNVPENQTRQVVFKYILNNPGCTISEISDELKLKRGCVKHHIYSLKYEGKIILKKMGKFMRLFQNSGAVNYNEQKMAAHLRNETDRMLLLAIFEMPGITNRELADMFDLAKSTIHWHIRNFHNDNVVLFEPEGRYKRYFIKTDVEMILLRFMPAKNL